MGTARGGYPVGLAGVEVIREVVEYAATRGADVGGALASVDIDPEDLDDAENFFDIEQWLRLQTAFAHQLHDPQFGLELARANTLRGYGLPGVLVEVAPTARRAMELLAQVLPRFMEGITFAVEAVGDGLAISYAVGGDAEITEVHRQEVIGGIRLNTQRLAGLAFEPLAVSLRQPHGDIATLSGFFGCPVTLGAPVDRIVLPLAACEAPAPRADATMLRHLLDAVDTQLQRRAAWFGRRKAVLHLDACDVDLATGRVRRGSEVLWLTSRERELLQFFAARPNQVVTHADIERDVWHMKETVVSHAPAVAVRRLRAKIEPPGPKPVSLLTVFGEGWKLVVR